jgi:hypothetical protein
MTFVDEPSTFAGCGRSSLSDGGHVVLPKLRIGELVGREMKEHSPNYWLSRALRRQLGVIPLLIPLGVQQSGIDVGRKSEDRASAQ